METLIQSLPRETQCEILSYTHRPQTPALCSDIQSYHRVRNTLQNCYDNRHPNTPETPIDDSSTAWLSNDIGRFLNNDVPTMYGFQTFYLDIFRRLFMNTDAPDEDLLEYVSKIGMSIFPQDIKISLALLTPSERVLLVEFLGAGDDH